MLLRNMTFLKFINSIFRVLPVTLYLVGGFCMFTLLCSCACDKSFVTAPVTIQNEGAVKPFKNSDQQQDAYISGRVTDIAGNPLSNVLIDVFNVETDELVKFTTTSLSGVYKIAVPIGKYVLNATPFDSQFNNQIYKNAPMFEDALTVEVTTDSNATNIDFELVLFFQ